MKKHLIYLLIAVMALSLFAACSNEPTNTPANTTTPAAPTTTDTPAEPTEPTEDSKPADTTTDEPTSEAPKGAYQLNIAEEKIVTAIEAGGILWEMPPVAKGPGASILPLATNGETLSVYRNFTTQDSSITSPEEVRANQIMEERTGVTIDWQLCTSPEQFNLMIVSEDYADMIWAASAAGGAIAYTGGVDKAIEDEVYTNAADYFHLTPNYVQLLESDKEIARNASTDSHNYFFTVVNSGVQGSFQGPIIRKDWLDQLNLEVPDTYDEWHTALTSFRDTMGASDALFVTTMTGPAADAGFTSGYDTYAGFYAKNGTDVTYGFTDEGMREYVTMMNQWFTEGLVYRDFPTGALGADMENFASGASGASSNSYFGFTMIIPMGIVPGSEWVGAPIPQKTEDSGISHIRGAFNTITQDSCIFITTAAVERGVDELAAKWIDYRYSEEGSVILYYGEEGRTFTWGEDGLPHINVEAWRTNTLEGKTYEYINSVFTESMVTYGTYVWLIQLTDTNSMEELAPIRTWNASATTDWVLPNVTMTSEEGELYRQIYGDIETYTLENFTKFIVGDKPLSEWDEYVATIESMGIQDCIDLYQAALDRYLAR